MTRLGALAVADFRERSRRPAYVVVLLGAVALGVLALPSPGSHWQVFQMGDYRGVYSSPYAGTVTALAGAVWLSLAGFYVVKNAIARDETTGVGQILAATPLGRAPYLAGKFAGNLAVLASMTAALAGTALVMQLWRGEDRHVDPARLLAPFLLITLPVLAVTAAAAVFFETVPGLRSGTGNIVWLFLWMTGSIGLQSGGGLDAFGMGRVTASMRADIARLLGDRQPGEFGVGLVERSAPLKVFRWSGADFGGVFLVQRLVLLAVAGGLAVLGALWFHRFDPARDIRRRRLARPDAEPAPRWEVAVRRPATPSRYGGGPLGLVRAEMRVLLGGVSRWWWVVAAALSLLAAVVPARGVGGAALPLCWVWPVLLWSRLGTQEYEHDLTGLLGAFPRRRARLVAGWAAGVVLTAVVGAVPLIRLLVAGDGRGVVAWVGGVLFIPALAFFVGILTRTGRPFQIIYLLWWYAILNGAASINFMAGPHPALVASAAAVLVLLAVAGLEVRHARRCGRTRVRPARRRRASLASARSNCPRSPSDGGGHLVGNDSHYQVAAFTGVSRRSARRSRRPAAASEEP